MHLISSMLRGMWDGIGHPASWLLIMVLIVVLEAINGATIMGQYWLAVCLFAMMVSRLVNAVEKIAEKNNQT